MPKTSDSHTRKSQNRSHSTQGEKLGPRVIYRINRRVKHVQVRPGAIRQVWAVFRRRFEATAPEIIEKTELHPKTAENCLWYLQQVGFISSVPLSAAHRPHTAAHAA